MPKVSVIIPVYGVEKYIERCARSLFEQTLDDIEYLFIDDCTPDGSVTVLKRVLEEYPQRKPQVTIHRMEQNSGQAKVREWGMKNATGEYVIHCDSDDWVDIRIYEKLYLCAIENKADIVVCDYYKVVDERVEVKHRVFDNSSKRALMTETLVGHQLNTLWNAMVCRSLYYDIRYPVGSQAEDKTLMIQIISQSRSVVHLPEPLYYYNCSNPVSISNSVTIEATKKRYIQYKNNQNVALGYLYDKGFLNNYKEQIEAYKFSAKMFLYYQYKDPGCRELWDKTYPDIKYSVFFNRYIRLKIKIMYLLTFFNIIKK